MQFITDVGHFKGVNDLTIRGGLRVQINKKNPLFHSGESVGEIDGGRRLADAAFLVQDGYCEHRGGWKLYVGFVSGRGARRDTC